MCMFESRSVWWPDYFDYVVSRSVKMCRLVFKSSYLPTLLWYLMLERAFMLAALFRELLALGFCYCVNGRSIHRCLWSSLIF
jgi:hypothetical protein